MNKNKVLKSSIIYVNFAPYENAGKILDYLLETFQVVVLFSFNFHHMGSSKAQNKLFVYFNGKIINTKGLFDFQVPESLVFPILPIRSFLIFSQLFLYLFYINSIYGRFDYYFSVNAFTSWAGNVFRKLGFVNKTIFWVWDYYPPKHRSKIITFMRWIYWQFDKMATKSDTIVFLNKRVVRLHKKIGFLDPKIKYRIIPIGTNPIKRKKTNKDIKSSKINLVFIGVVKKSQGLDLIYNRSISINKGSPKININVIGSGPELNYFKEISKNCSYQSNFHGFLPDIEVDKVLRRSDIGIATYEPSKNNVSYYGDPSKIKQYLSYGLPVITTNVFEFSKEIISERAGMVINYNKPQELSEAINKITKRYSYYRDNSLRLARSLYYKRIYPGFFK